MAKAARRATTNHRPLMQGATGGAGRHTPAAAPGPVNPRRYIEWVLLAVVLIVLAIRATYGESPHTDTIDPLQPLTNTGFSVLLSGVLLVAVMAGFVMRVVDRRHGFQLTGLEIGLGLFLFAAIVSCLVASDKRAAVTDALTLATPMLAAALLVRLLDRPARIRWVLAIVVAAGLVNVMQSAQQAMASNQMLIEQYEKDPQAFLEPLGIEPGTFKALLYEHRLYGKDVRGFFTTGNSAGSFLILSVAALAALWLGRPRGAPVARAWMHAVFVFCLMRLVGGMVLVHSKGATVAAVAGAILFVVGGRLGPWLRRHRAAVAAGGLLVVLGLAGALTVYGRRHGTLPGGRSMLIRWEYWTATARMVQDHPLAGVGGGNFRHYYPRYKADAALETVQDPHNFVLSLLSQYGPLGLLGFVLAIGIPAWRAAGRYDAPPVAGEQDGGGVALRSAAVALVAAGVVFATRPFFLMGQATQRAEVQSVTVLCTVLYLYIVPAAMLGAGTVLLLVPFSLLAVVAAGAVVFFELVESVLFDFDQVRPATVMVGAALLYAVPLFLLGVCWWRGRSPKSGVTGHDETVRPAFYMWGRWVLWCGLVTVLLAGLVDFALFEPGVYTAFWVILACAVASRAPQSGDTPSAFAWTPGPRMRKVLAGLLIVATIGVVYVAVVLPVQAGYLRQQVSRGREAPALLNRAACVDPLDPSGLRDAAKLCLWRYEQTGESSWLAPAVKTLEEALRRNPASFKDDVLLARTYRFLAQSDEHPDPYYELALRYVEQAVRKYPGSAELHMDLAEIAEALGRTSLALEHYERAVEIEQAFQEHFRRMYPGRSVVSRLGAERYEMAQRRVEQLRNQSSSGSTLPGS